jgi:predicted CXXCH cytochrome family protein
VPAGAKSTHQVVADGECRKCHDPHASDNPASLVARGNDLCVGCHKDIGEAIATAKFKHRPVEQGCVTCHGPHGSAAADHLLVRPVPELCVGCHDPGQPTFAARHMKYPVGKASCTSCHDPHGSGTSAMLFTDVHAPVANRACGQCHENPDSPTPFATRRPGYELCRGCHAEMVNATLAKDRLHWPVADRTGCANCHSPHASRQPKLLAAGTTRLCGACHAETVRRIGAAAARHAPVENGECVTCHAPHGARGTFLVDQPSIIELCTGCHDYEQHSAHPIGADAIDPRNKNLRVDCLSCHGGHGTPYKWMLLAETNVELCTQCHKQFGR